LDPMGELFAYTLTAGTGSGRALARDEGREFPRHLKVTGPAPAFGFERCEDIGCTVDAGGTASSCGRLACPVCGCGGTNLTTMELLDDGAATRMRCSCGHAWMREQTLERPEVALAS
jgi:hypothetical protein